MLNQIFAVQLNDFDEAAANACYEYFYLMRPSYENFACDMDDAYGVKSVDYRNNIVVFKNENYLGHFVDELNNQGAKYTVLKPTLAEQYKALAEECAAFVGLSIDGFSVKEISEGVVQLCCKLNGVTWFLEPLNHHDNAKHMRVMLMQNMVNFCISQGLYTGGEK